ncbi:hypothetical protein K443DRAFT_124181 [Laccaria amethystina LaAM-08-1]|uniref:Uncharacterized protein n=1 Tax=Laccaria amethystina LaAM-08-1 TaxID=1095629 RepID=A0A0C9WWX9_9AGAR|nr:hypothetical protein K443DRAFT_124181 [Laccaria amethystina LaAM-08-1]
MQPTLGLSSIQAGLSSIQEVDNNIPNFIQVPSQHSIAGPSTNKMNPSNGAIVPSNINAASSIGKTRNTFRPSPSPIHNFTSRKSMDLSCVTTSQVPPSMTTPAPASMIPQTPSSMIPQAPALMTTQAPASMIPQTPVSMIPQAPALMIPQAPASTTTQVPALAAAPALSVAIAPQHSPVLSIQQLRNIMSDVDINMDLMPIPGQYDVFYGFLDTYQSAAFFTFALSDTNHSSFIAKGRHNL